VKPSAAKVVAVPPADRQFVPRDSFGGRAYEQLAASIRAMILAGELGDGERLPSETVLAAQAGVSRPTVREALRVLQEWGFIERASPRILVVRTHTEEPAVREMTRALRRRNVTFRSLHEALLTLEPDLAALAAERRDDGDLRTLRALIDEQRASIAQFPRWCRLDDDFHMAIAEASGNPPLTLARASVSVIVVPTSLQFVRSERVAEAAIDFHERIFDEIRARDSEAAAFVARRHINDFRQAWERSGLAYDRALGELIDAGSQTLLAPDQTVA
jgi:GntR family transcriptional regulator, transcriptional repressor for pyruvate dehydrogenase complex